LTEDDSRLQHIVNMSSKVVGNTKLYVLRLQLIPVVWPTEALFHPSKCMYPSLASICWCRQVTFCSRIQQWKSCCIVMLPDECIQSFCHARFRPKFVKFSVHTSRRT